MGTGAALHIFPTVGLAGHTPTRAQYGADTEAACEIDPLRRTC
jgi:hypothetical protein